MLELNIATVLAKEFLIMMFIIFEIIAHIKQY